MNKPAGYRQIGFLLGIVLVLTLPVVVFLLFSLSGEPDDPGSRPILLAHDKGVFPVFQKNYERQGKAAAEAVGVGFIPVPSDTTDLFINRMRAQLPTREAPEFFTWWSTWRVRPLVENDLVADLTHLWDKYDDIYPEVIRNAYTIGGRVYGFPYSVEYWPVWYNRDVFERLGLSEPRTWQEFIEACDTLKAAGIDPILQSFQADWYAVIWFAQLIIGEDPDFYRSLCDGDAAYGDASLERALSVYADMIRSGYFTSPSANMLTNAGHLWNNERFGMVLAGSWYHSTVLLEQGVDPDSIGVFILPPHNPDAEKTIMMESGPIFTAKNAPRRQEAEAIADWWMSMEGSSRFSEGFGAYSANHAVDPAYLQPVRRKLLDTMNAEGWNIVNRYWEATPSPIVDAAIEALTRFFIDPDAKHEVIAELEAAADAFWEQAPPDREARAR